MKRLLIVGSLILSTGCDPPCLKGHSESRHREEYYTMEVLMTMPVGDIDMPIYHSVHHPPSDYTVFICDQYQAEKP